MSAWHEMVIEGKEEDVRELLPGVATDGERPYWGDELDLHAGLFPERIRQLYEVRGAIDALAARLAAGRARSDAS